MTLNVVDIYFISAFVADPDNFTMKIHHRGNFKEGKYLSGRVQWVDNCIGDPFSMLDMYDIATSLRYNKLKTCFHYRSTTKAFLPLETDGHVLEFVQQILSSRVQNLYLPHKPEPPVRESSICIYTYISL